MNFNLIPFILPGFCSYLLTWFSHRFLVSPISSNSQNLFYSLVFYPGFLPGAIPFGWAWLGVLWEFPLCPFFTFTWGLGSFFFLEFRGCPFTLCRTFELKLFLPRVVTFLKN